MGVFPQPRPERFGRYILLDRINVGGMAEVFRGKMGGVEGFERMVALKRILPNIAADPDFVEMFVDEAKLAVQLQHANIAQIYELGKEHDAYFIAMEYVSGVDLRTMWDRARNRNRLLPIAMSCHVMQKVCEGLDAAHRKKDDQGNDISLVHRDVSPQNILVSFEGEVKVIDFGIARAANKVSKTQAGVLKGKFGYMSPEQVRGMDLDNRSDIFACGVLLYELLVGDRLFLGESDFSTLEKVRNVEMVPPTRLNKNLSPQLERIVMKALAKNREDRYRWAAEMAEDLQRYLFSTNQPFARTDLQRYMQQHFKEDLAKEQERLDGYKSVTLESVRAQEAPAYTPAARAETELAYPSGAPPHIPTALKATPLSLSDALAPGAYDPGPLRGGPPPVQLPPPKQGLPTWAAALIGGLVVVVLGVVGVLAYLLMFAKPEPGALTVEVTPAKADIYLNDELVANQAPFTLDHVTPDTYVLKVQAPNHEPVIRAIRVAPGESRLETVALTKKQGSAGIVVRSNPEGLKVAVDGKDTGRITPATITGLEAGEHHVVLLRDDGSIVHRVRVNLAEGSAEELDVEVSRLSSVLDVTSEPPGAEVTVNGQLKGATPVTIGGLSAGRHTVRVSRPGCATHEEAVALARSTVMPLVIKLSCDEGEVDANQETGRLNVTATVVSDIYVDGRRVGRTPSMGLRVPTGKRTLKLVPLAAGKAPYETEILIDTGAKDVNHVF
ncbi:MAG: serine/threonine protein kinase [Myxococcales bacterium]|nr:serine/threonine protein kinase [Myxococcales bacterium]